MLLFAAAIFAAEEDLADLAAEQQLIEAEIAAAEARHTPETAAAVARSLRRVSNALLHPPSVRAAELARTGGLEDYTNALHVLFGIDVEPLR